MIKMFIMEYLLSFGLGILVMYWYVGYKTRPKCPKCHPAIDKQQKKINAEYCINCGTKLKHAKIVYE